MNMMVSGVSEKNGRKIAYILFEDEDKRSAEAVIPECRVISNNGFSEEEVAQLEDYVRRNLTDLKKRAAGINPVTALMKD